MSRDFDDKETDVPVDEEEVSSNEPVTEEGHDDSRRGFLKSLGKWSGAAIGIALLGGAMSPSDAEAGDNPAQKGWDDFVRGAMNPSDAEADDDPSRKIVEPWLGWRCRCRCFRCRCRCRCRCL